MAPGMKEKGSWTKRDGKRFVYEAGMLLNFIAFVCLFLSFCSPYWIISWPRVYSGFKRIGLWEICFAGMVLETDPTQKAYHGCWWILAPEFWNIKGWLMPPWFIYTQVNVTFCFVAYGVVFVTMFIIWLKTGRTQRKASQKRRDPLKAIQTGVAITCVSASLMAINMMVFALLFKYDRNWLPHPFFNYLSWSYGMALMATFFQIFASIAQVTYVLIVRQEMREPPSTVPLAGYMPASKA